MVSQGRDRCVTCPSNSATDSSSLSSTSLPVSAVSSKPEENTANVTGKYNGKGAAPYDIVGDSYFRLNRQLYVDIIETLPVPVCWKDTSHTYRGYNQRFLDLFGEKRSFELRGRRDTDLPWFSADTAATICSFEERVLQTLEPACYKLAACTSAGPRYLKVQLVPLRSHTGRLLGIQGCYEDCTEHERLTVALRDAEALLRGTMRQIPAAVFIVDTDLFASVCSDCRSDVPFILGQSGARRALREIVSGTQADVIENHAVRALRGEHAHTVLQEGNKSFLFQMRPLRPLKQSPRGGDDMRQIVGALGLIVPLSDPGVCRHGEANVCSHELFSRSVAHDLNNVLQSMLAHTAFLGADTGPGFSEAPRVQALSHAGELATRLVRSLLSRSGPSVSRNEVDLNQLLKETSELVSNKLPAGALLHLALDDALPTLSGDKVQLEQLSMNLIINAIESLEGKPGTVQVSTGTMSHPADLPPGGVRTGSRSRSSAELAHGRYAYLKVTDSGDGIDTGTQEKIFEPFFSTKAGGRGLGLATVVRAAEAHGGMVHLTSSPGSGSAFIVLLPLARAARRSGQNA